MKRLVLIIPIMLALVGTAQAKELPEEGSGTIALAPGSELRYQGRVSFTVTGTENLRNPRIWVSCFKPDLEGRLVYGEGGGADETFKLGGDSSTWVQEGGGPAWCSARLYYILARNGKTEFHVDRQPEGGTVTLAEMTFFAGENA